MKKIFYTNFLLGSILLIILFLNLAVISVEMTFGSANESNYISYLVIGIIDFIYLSVIIAINNKLIRKSSMGIKNVLLNSLLPVLLPTLVAILVLFIYDGGFQSNYHSAIPK